MAYHEAFTKAADRELVPKNYLARGLQTSTTMSNLFRHLMDQRKMPENGWDDRTIEILLHEIASLDSNNFSGRVGVGEREGRVYSSLVARRHYGFSHGIGRSGNLVDPQPKAAGSTMMAALTNSLVLDFLKKYVSNQTVDAFVLPMATGMSICLTLQAMKKFRPNAEYVVWSRIDQQSCMKAIMGAGLKTISVDTMYLCDETLCPVQTNVRAIAEVVKEKGVDNVLCIITTTSCFAPRMVDDVEAIALLCKDTPMFHLVNNAYGLQSSKCSHAIREGNRKGRVDIYIQSTDKNLLVPVGGTMVAGFSKEIVQEIQSMYPGRASSSQSLDVFITLLSLGINGYGHLLRKRKEIFDYLRIQMSMLATKHKEFLIPTPRNDISIAMTLNMYPNNATKLGSMLFSRNVLGARVVEPACNKSFDCLELEGWGTHTSSYKYPYLTAAAAIGMEMEEVDLFIRKLSECLTRLDQQNKKKMERDRNRKRLK